MDGLFIFDGSNDLIFEKLNDQIKEKLLDSAQKQGLLDPVSYFYIFQKKSSIWNKWIFLLKSCTSIADIDNNIIMQIFSPLITSQRIMLCQFDNSYSSIQCENNFTIVLEEVSNSVNFYFYGILKVVFLQYLGYLFLKAGSDVLEFMQKSIKIFIACVKRVCGPNVHL